eukprot:44480_1
MAEWIKLEKVGSTYCSRPIMLNRNEFIVATDAEGALQVKHGLYIYNILNNEWRILIEFEESIKYTGVSLAIDYDRQLIYMVGYRRGLVIVDLKTNKHEHIREVVATGMYSPMTIIDHKLHLFTGSSNNKHLRWNVDKQTFDTLYTFNEWLDGNTNPGLSHIHTKTSNAVYLFGGNDSLLYSSYLDHIWHYSEQTKQWNLLDLRLPHKMMHFGYATSYDEKYIIISGGERDTETKMDNIYIFEIDKGIIYESPVSCPRKSLYHSTIMPEPNDKIVLFYMKKQSVALNMNIPSEIYDLVCQWCSVDYLYLIDDTGHWKTPVFDLIQNATIVCQ